jgi:hypothetical protein
VYDYRVAERRLAGSDEHTEFRNLKYTYKLKKLDVKLRALEVNYEQKKLEAQCHFVNKYVELKTLDNNVQRQRENDASWLSTLGGTTAVAGAIVAATAAAPLAVGAGGLACLTGAAIALTGVNNFNNSQRAERQHPALTFLGI